MALEVRLQIANLDDDDLVRQRIQPQPPHVGHKNGMVAAAPDDDMHATDLQHRLGVLARRQVAHDAAHGQRLARDRSSLPPSATSTSAPTPAASMVSMAGASAMEAMTADGTLCASKAARATFVSPAPPAGIVARIADEDARFRRGQRPVDTLVDGAGRHAKLEFVARPSSAGRPSALRVPARRGSVPGDDRGASPRGSSAQT